jgi:hypothetical protein
MEPITETQKAPALKTPSELIYLDAIENQGEKGDPIFYGEIKLFKTTKKGNSPKILRTHYTARKIVFQGNLAKIKADKAVLLSCLTFIYDKKKAFEERKTGAWFIDSVNIEKFLGYGFKSS